MKNLIILILFIICFLITKLYATSHFIIHRFILIKHFWEIIFLLILFIYLLVFNFSLNILFNFFKCYLKSRIFWFSWFSHILFINKVWCWITFFSNQFFDSFLLNRIIYINFLINWVFIRWENIFFSRIILLTTYFHLFLI